MWNSYLDHLVVTAPALEVGVAYVEETLNVRMQPGGEHIRMGTHNALLKISDGCYLEVIAINPQAPPPGRPRWFALDQLRPKSKPRLATWVVRTSNILQAVAAAGVQLGPVEPMSRGSLEWQISIPEDGSLPIDGIAPTMIEWSSDPHPSSRLHDLGLSLIQLQGFHPEADRINNMLDQIGFEGAVHLQTCRNPLDTRLLAILNTPSGPVMLT